MPGTETAPAVDSVAPPLVQLSVRWIDYSGDKRADSYLIAPAATDIQINAFVDALQAASNASIYEVQKTLVFASNPGKANALEEVWENVTDNVVLQMKNPTTQQSQRVFIPSPINDMFVEGEDDIDPADATLDAVKDAFVAVLPAGYGVIGGRFTSRRQMNQQIPLNP